MLVERKEGRKKMRKRERREGGSIFIDVVLKNLFVFGCSGSLFQHTRGTLRCGAQASDRGWFLLLESKGFRVHRLRSYGA